MKRRALLKIAPFLPFAGQKAASDLAQINVGTTPFTGQTDPILSRADKRFTNFASYWKWLLENETIDIRPYRIDVDIACRRSWSLAAKYRAQRARDIEAFKRERRWHFKSVVSENGFFEVYKPTTGQTLPQAAGW